MAYIIAYFLLIINHWYCMNLNLISPNDEEHILTEEELQAIYQSIDVYDDSPPTILYFFKKTPLLKINRINQIKFPNYTCYDHEYSRMDELDLNVSIVSQLIDVDSPYSFDNYKHSIKDAIVEINSEKNAIDIIPLNESLNELDITFSCAKKSFVNHTNFKVHLTKPIEKPNDDYQKIQIIYEDQGINETIRRLKNASCTILKTLNDDNKCNLEMVLFKIMENKEHYDNGISLIKSIELYVNKEKVSCIEMNDSYLIKKYEQLIIENQLKILDFKMIDAQPCQPTRGESNISKFIAPIVIVLAIIAMGSICCAGFICHRRRNRNKNAKIFKPRKPAILIEEIDNNNELKAVENDPLRKYEQTNNDNSNNENNFFNNSFKPTRDPPPYDN